MSEHQIVAFRAIDGPVSEKNLEYMEKQSSRAEITPWSFDNEYDYSDFRGDAEEMLRRGYDLHVHYADFGIRKLMIRLPNGLPNAKAAKAYLDDESLTFKKDRQGDGGILEVSPFDDSGIWDYLGNFEDIVECLISLRGEILEGDLRPLYLAHLAVACDSNHDPETTNEGPVPAGLNALTKAQEALAEFYSLGDTLIAAAAQAGPPLPAKSNAPNQQMDWLKGLPQERKDAWLAELLSDPQSSVRREMLAEFMTLRDVQPWPTIIRNRTISELLAAADAAAIAAKQKAADKAAREKAKRLEKMAADPAPTLTETEKLAATRTTNAYSQIAKLLVELRESLAGTEQAGLAEHQAVKLKSKHPTLKMLISELRKQGFLAK